VVELILELTYPDRQLRCEHIEEVGVPAPHKMRQLLEVS
jgi:hypothetical protein